MIDIARNTSLFDRFLAASAAGMLLTSSGVYAASIPGSAAAPKSTDVWQAQQALPCQNAGPQGLQNQQKIAQPYPATRPD